MLRIFAKNGTDEKISVFCRQDQIPGLQIEFEKQFGGQWLLVDDVKTSCEILKFNDGQIYRGFEPNQPFGYRYSSAIKKFIFR